MKGMEGCRGGEREIEWTSLSVCVFTCPVGIRENTPFRVLVRAPGHVDCKSP